MTVRFKVTVGNAACELEGPEEFVRNAIETLLLPAAHKLSTIERPSSENATLNQKITSTGTPNGASTQSFSTSTIASKIKCASGTDLIRAAAIKLTLSDSMESFTRLQILESMKTASAFYKDTYSGNLSKYLNQLTREGILNELGTGQYALAAEAISEATVQLGA